MAVLVSCPSSSFLTVPDTIPLRRNRACTQNSSHRSPGFAHCVCRVVHIMIQTMSEMLKMKVIRVSEVSRWLTMSFLAFREALTQSYTTTNHKNGRNPLKTGFYQISTKPIKSVFGTKLLQRAHKGILHRPAGRLIIFYSLRLFNILNFGKKIKTTDTMSFSIAKK